MYIIFKFSFSVFCGDLKDRGDVEPRPGGSLRATPGASRPRAACCAAKLPRRTRPRGRRGSPEPLVAEQISAVATILGKFRFFTSLK